MLLTRAVRYEVSGDEYRKYEGGKKPSFMPLDLIFHFAELTSVTAGVLLAPAPFQEVATLQPPERRRHTSRTSTY